jgi:osmoprotectant transport system substrate-binding protein
MVAGNATDGLIAAMGLTMLRDDKSYFPPYEAALAVRGAALESRPGLREALAELYGENFHGVDAEHELSGGREASAVRDVARDFPGRPLAERIKID